MGRKIAWVTDTAAFLTPEFIKQHNIHVLPLNVVFEDKPFSAFTIRRIM